MTFLKAFVLFSLLVLLAAPEVFAEGGGNSIELGGATKVFDAIEYSEPFLPAEMGGPWRRIDEQLEVLSTKLPYTAKYLRSFYEGGKTVWWFVTVKLRDTKDAGRSNLVLSFQKEQIASNQGGKIQIRKDLWAKLDEDSRATLLVHEMLWSAIGPEFLRDGAPIRFLSRFLLHPGLKQFSPEIIADWFTSEIGNAKSPLLEWIEYDRKRGKEARFLEVEQVSDPPRTDTVIKVVGYSSLLGMRISVPRPNPRYPEVSTREAGPGAGATSGYSGGGLPLLDLMDVCGGLDYGKQQGWRLPTKEEVLELRRMGLFRMSVQNGEVMRRLTAKIEKPGRPPLHYEAQLVPTYDGSLYCIDEQVTGLRQNCETVLDQLFYKAIDVPYFCVMR